jgi:hypothetical protein
MFPTRLKMFYVVQISIQCHSYNIRLFCNIPCCSVQVQRVKSSSPYKQTGFYNPGIILIKQQNLMGTPFTCPTTVWNVSWILWTYFSHYINTHNDRNSKIRSMSMSRVRSCLPIPALYWGANVFQPFLCLSQTNLNSVRFNSKLFKFELNIPKANYQVRSSKEEETKHNKQNQTPWLQSASELYRPSYRRFSAKLVPTLADRGCRVVSTTNRPLISVRNKHTQAK